MSVADAGLSARAAQLLYAYARAVDQRDIEALRGLAAPDIWLTRSDVTHKRITVQRVVTIPSGRTQYLEPA